jgi:hypothetical protein
LGAFPGTVKSGSTTAGPDKSGYRRCEIKLRILELRPGPLKTFQELLESGTVSSWCDEGGLFVAIPVDLKKVFGRKRSAVDFLAELKGNDGILVAVDDQNWGVDFL